MAHGAIRGHVSDQHEITGEPWTVARARYSALRRHHGDDPEWADRIAEAREALRVAHMDESITRAVAEWEPLTLEQRARIAVLLLQPAAA